MLPFAFARGSNRQELIWSINGWPQQYNTVDGQAKMKLMMDFAPWLGLLELDLRG
jgi:hypothetical protein